MPRLSRLHRVPRSRSPFPQRRSPSGPKTSTLNTERPEEHAGTLLNAFGNGRVRVHAAVDVVERGAHLDEEGDPLDGARRLRSDDAEPKDLSRILRGEELHEAPVLRMATLRATRRLSTTPTRYGILRSLAWSSLRPTLATSGFKEHDGRECLVADRARVETEHLLDGIAALELGDVGERYVHRDVACRVDVRDRRLRSVRDDAVVLVDLHAGILEAEGPRVRDSADRHERALDADRLRSFLRRS